MQEIIKSGNIDDLCPSSVVNELEIRTRGQHENPLWYKVKNRITASIFHDALTRKSNTPPQKLVPVERLLEILSPLASILKFFSGDENTN